MQAGARCPDIGLLTVLLDDAELLEAELRKNPSLNPLCIYAVTWRVLVACESRDSFAQGGGGRGSEGRGG